MPRNTILLRGTNVEELSGTADAALTPGMLVEPTATGFRRHATAAGPAAALFVRERHESTHTGTGIDDVIPQGDTVSVMLVPKSAKINAYTTDTIAVGGYVESDGVGGVRAVGSGTRLGVATAASDLSGDVGRVEIIII